jgi:hypothetical protein
LCNPQQPYPHRDPHRDPYYRHSFQYYEPMCPPSACYLNPCTNTYYSSHPICYMPVRCPSLKYYRC